jgi:hypothetical protein
VFLRRSIRLQGEALLPRPFVLGDGSRCIGAPLRRLNVEHDANGSSRRRASFHEVSTAASALTELSEPGARSASYLGRATANPVVKSFATSSAGTGRLNK